MNDTVGEYIDRWADRHGWVIDWNRGTVRMPKRHARYARPLLTAADRIARFIRIHGGTLWCVALAFVCFDSASRENWSMALLSALFFGARAEQQLHPKAKYGS